MSKISDNSHSFLETQETHLSDLQRVVKETPDLNFATFVEIEKSIKALKEEAKNCREEDLPGIMFQLNLQHSLAQRFSQEAEIPDLTSPYFGYMQIKQNEKVKDLFLGHTPFNSDKLDFKIIDWKNAPIAKIFYQFDEGEDFDFDVDDRTIEGTILKKSVLTIHDGNLIRVDADGKSFVKRDGEWINYEEEVLKLQGGEQSAFKELSLGTGRTNLDSPDVISLLDKTQFELVNRDANEPLLVIGGAGSGKTTVALFRLARLVEKKKFYPGQALVMVPSEGLVRLSKTLLTKIGLKDVKVETTQKWLEKSCFQLFKKIPRKFSEDTPLGTQIIKRHLSIVKIFEDYICEQAGSVLKRIESISENGNLISLYKQQNNMPLIKRIELLGKSSIANSFQKIELRKIWTELINVREDLLNIFSSKSLLSKLPEISGGVVTEKMLLDTKLHTAKHIELYDTDKDYSAKESGKKQVHGLMDYEDLPLLLLLLEMKSGPLPIKTFKHILLDEAQELSPVELMVIKNGLREKGNFTIAGDAAQQIDPTISFKGWDTLVSHLGKELTDTTLLNVSYRSPKEVVEFAYHVLGPLAPDEPPVSTKIGGPVLKTQVQHRAHASLVLNDALTELTTRENKASIAIICDKVETAKDFYEELADIGNVRLVLEDDFSLRPGIDITTTDQIRGLEFDYVIIPDADKENYPVTSKARKRLHLASTRAIHQLWVLHPFERTLLF